MCTNVNPQSKWCWRAKKKMPDCHFPSYRIPSSPLHSGGRGKQCTINKHLPSYRRRLKGKNAASLNNGGSSFHYFVLCQKKIIHINMRLSIRSWDAYFLLRYNMIPYSTIFFKSCPRTTIKLRVHLWPPYCILVFKAHVLRIALYCLRYSWILISWYRIFGTDAFLWFKVPRTFFSN